MRTGRAARRVRRRVGASGFTLIELLVVVTLVGILTAIAMPAMRQARDDRLVFDYARQTQAMLHRARVRAAGTGSAHLVVIDTNNRGTVRLFQALDGSAATPSMPGPLPRSSCKLANEWNDTASMSSASLTAPIIEGLDLNTAGVNVDANVKLTASAYGAAATAAVLCVTPGGNAYVGVGGNAAGAIADMQTRTPFTDVLEVDVTRRTSTNAQAGLMRQIIVAGSGAPRVRSQ